MSSRQSASPPEMPHVGIIILNWRRPVETVACLESLQRMDYPSLEVVVVDNASRNGSTERIRRRFPHVALIQNETNLGFAAGNNVGIDHLLRGGADYVMLLNDDTEVSPELVRTLVDAGESRAEVGILGPKICYFDRPDVIWSAGGTVDRYGEPRHRCVDQVADAAPESVQEVDYVTGCCMLVKRSVIERVGRLDGRFFAYFEEAEWCARARRAGYRVVYVPRALVWHKIESSARTTSRLYFYLMTRNRLLYLQCTGASRGEMLQAVMDLLRTTVSWSIRPRHREMRAHRGAVLRGVLDFAVGRFGAPPVRL